MFGFEAVMYSMIVEIKIRETREAYINSLPADKQEIARERDRQARKERLKHERKLEIAREGRPLNFWGNR